MIWIMPAAKYIVKVRLKVGVWKSHYHQTDLNISWSLKKRHFSL